MKILLLISSLDIGGAESHVVTLASAMASLGHEITVGSSGGEFADELSKNGVKQIYFPFDKIDTRNIFSLFSCARRLFYTISKNKYDIIHAHTRPTAFLANTVCKGLKVPLVTTVHARFRTGWIYRRLSCWGERTIAVCEELRHYVCTSYGIDSENTRVIQNGINTSLFYPRGTKIKVRRITFASRLDGDCSLLCELLLKLAPRLKERYGDIEICICGGGEKYRELKERAKKYPYVELLGAVRDMAAVLWESHAFIGVSRAAMEAMSCGIPVILGGNEGYFGLLNSDRDIHAAALENFCCRHCSTATDEGLFTDICRIFDMTCDERARISARLSEYILKHCSSSSMAKSTLDVYSELIPHNAQNGHNILLCGYYGYGNMGDNALLRASAALAKKKYPHSRISALTKAPKKDCRRFSLPCIRRMSPFAVMRAIRRSDLLVFGGGTLLQDRTSLRSLIYYWWLIYFASRSRTRVELWGNGIGETCGRLSERLIRSSLLRCSYIGVRDRTSYSRALNYSSSLPLYLDGDLAAGQSGASEARVEYLLQTYGLDEKNAPRGFAIAAIKGSTEAGYMQILINRLYELRVDGLKILLLPMFPREDLKKTARLAKDLGARVAVGLSESDTVGLMRKAEVVLGMRLHALVFASAASTPFVGFGGDSKIESFCKENGGVYFTELY